MISSSLSGIQNGLELINNASNQIASGNIDRPEPYIDMIKGEHQVKASTASAKAYNETIGTIIDIFA